MQFEFASAQIQGKRAAQEDTVDVLMPSVHAEKPGELARSGLAGDLVVVVADGMGGHVGGRVASNLSSKYFLESVNRSSGDWNARLNQALLQANEVLRTATDQRPELNGMGSTLVGGVINQQGVGWVSVGDSSLYLCRDGHLHRLNEDHSFGAYLDQQVREGLLAPEAAAADRRRNQLFHALLGEPLDHYEQFSGFHELHPGDVVLLASDGLKTLTDEQIAGIIVMHADKSQEDLARHLLDAVEAENRERQDNTSLIVVRVKEGEAPAPRHSSSGTTTISLASVRESTAGALDALETGEGASSVMRQPDSATEARVAPAPPPTATPNAEERAPDAPRPRVTETAPSAAPPRQARAMSAIVAALVLLVLALGGLAFWLYVQDLAKMKG